MRHLYGVCAAEGDLRLVGGGISDDGSAEYGRLEIFRQAGWGSICDSLMAFLSPVPGRSTPGGFFSRDSVGVACRQLGYPQGIKSVRRAVRSRICIAAPILPAV